MGPAMPTVNTNNGQLHYDLVDTTPPWVESPETILFHHGVAINSGIWGSWIPELSDKYRILTFDVRGYGRSHIPGENFEWSFESLAQDVMAVADAAEIENFHFVGESMGGAMGLYLGRYHPERLLSITPCTSPHNGGKVQWLAEWRDFITKNGMKGWSKRMMERRFFPDGISKNAEEWFASTQEACSPHSVLGQGEMLLNVDLTSELQSITKPVHLIAADSSPFLPLATTLDIHNSLPNSEIDVIANARHGVVFSHSKLCAQSLRTFIEHLK
jgi:3-oxoadipate enol-lactonase